MSVNLVPEDDLRAALRPYRVDPDAFEAGVRQRLKAAEAERADDPLARLSPLLRSAAAFLPLEVLAGCKGTTAAAKLAPATGAYKLLSYLAFPAISVFVLLGATVFSIAKIRNIREGSGSGLDDQQAIREAARQWWSRNKWGAYLVFAATLIMSLVGATWLLFLFYIITFGLLLYVLATFAKLGLGNREVIGRSSLLGLMFLGQVAMISGIGNQEIHFVDQMLVAAVFYGGVLLLTFVIGSSQITGWRVEKMPEWVWSALVAHVLVTLLFIGIMWSIFPSVLLTAILLVGALVPVASMIYRARMAGQRIGIAPQRLAMGLIVILLVPLMAWMLNPYLWPATPTRIKHYVESFEDAPVSFVRWLNWEIVARWAIDSKLDPDLSHARQLLVQEIAGEQNPFVLASAFRTGLVYRDQLDQLKDYQVQRRLLLAEPPRGLIAQPILSLNQQDWVIRAAVLRNDLSPQERDLLEQRLHATLERNLSEDSNVVLDEPLRVTQLLEAIGRPANRDQYRERVHDLLRKFHTKNTGGFRFAGGFKQYLSWPAGSWLAQPGSLEPTSSAVELMEIYGVPGDLDLNWVRSFLRPSVYRFSDDKWVAAATLERLNHLPGVTPPTWLEYLYYERTLLAATVLVGLCIYATLSSPKLKTADSANGSSPPDPPDIAAGKAG